VSERQPVGDFGNDKLAGDIDYAQQLAESRNNTGAQSGE
jgi:hypothetical protein